MNVWSYLSRLITLSLQQKCYVLQVTIKTPERRQQKYYVLQVTIKTPERRRSGVFIVTLNIFTHQLNAYVIRLKVGIYELGVFLQL